MVPTKKSYLPGISNIHLFYLAKFSEIKSARARKDVKRRLGPTTMVVTLSFIFGGCCLGADIRIKAVLTE